MPTNTRLDRYVEGVLPEANGGTGGSTVVNSVVAGTNVTVDNTDPNNPIVSSTGGGAVDSVNGKTGVVVLDTADIAEVTDKNYVTDAEAVVIGNTSNTNTGDQTSIVGITGTTAEFNTALSDGSFTTNAGTEILSNKSLQDSTTNFIGSSDPTKKVQLEVDGVSTLTTRTLTVQDKDYTLADDADIPTTTGELTESIDANYVSDAELVVIGNTSGTNTGDQDVTFTTTSNVTSNSGGILATDDFVFGSDQLDDDGVNDARFMFDKSQSSFRAGICLDTSWDAINRGGGSFAANKNTKAVGTSSAAFGDSCEATGEGAFALGYFNISSGVGSLATGFTTTASGAASISAGLSSKSLGDYSFAGGNTVDALAYASFAFGNSFRNDKKNSIAVGYGTGSTDTSGIGIALEADADQDASKKSAIYVKDTVAPTSTTNRLYSVGGDLYWNGVKLN